MSNHSDFLFYRCISMKRSIWAINCWFWVSLCQVRHSYVCLGWYLHIWASGFFVFPDAPSTYQNRKSAHIFVTRWVQVVKLGANDRSRWDTSFGICFVFFTHVITCVQASITPQITTFGPSPIWLQVGLRSQFYPKHRRISVTPWTVSKKSWPPYVILVVDAEKHG